jgi:SAM-dependent methyltransferase
LKAGDFSDLAENYAASRPGYSETVLDALLGLFEQPGANLDVVDVGAGTGIWTKMLAHRGPRSLRAVEPNTEMRQLGERYTDGSRVDWIAGSGEETTLVSDSADWICMASSFHWVDLTRGLAEFQRVLRPGGRFTALWNPRLIEVNPILVDIEAELQRIGNGITRVSSGRSGITQTLTEDLLASKRFDDVVYIEGRHLIEMTPDRYLSIWRSVNDVRAQLGEERFDSFLTYVERRVSEVDVIEATYLTRSWTARSTKS